MRLVHFSDIHICRWTRSRRAWFDKRILGLGNYALRRRSKLHEAYVAMAIERMKTLTPDLVVCSGDITCVGSPEEFEHAAAILRPLATHSDFDFLYVPGNHDAYVKSRHSRGSLEETFSSLNRGRWKVDDLPVVVEYGPVRVWMVNQCFPTSIVRSSGELRPAARDTLKHWIQQERRSGEIRLLLGHFPTQDADGMPLSRRRRLNGVELLKDALEKDAIDISLCGHIHDPFLARHGSNALEACAGSLTMTGVVNVLDIDEATGHVTQHWVSVLTPEADAEP